MGGYKLITEYSSSIVGSEHSIILRSHIISDCRLSTDPHSFRNKMCNSIHNYARTCTIAWMLINMPTQKRSKMFFRHNRHTNSRRFTSFSVRVKKDSLLFLPLSLIPTSCNSLNHLRYFLWTSSRHNAYTVIRESVRNCIKSE